MRTRLMVLTHIMGSNRTQTAVYILRQSSNGEMVEKWIKHFNQ
jgi:hypothetical protein